MSFKETINENDEKNSSRSHHILLKHNQSQKEESKIQKKTYEQANEKTVVHLDSEYRNRVTPNGGWKLDEKVHDKDLSSSKKTLELNSRKETQTVPSNLSTKNDFDQKEIDIPRAMFQKSSPVAKAMKETEEILLKRPQESLPKKELSSPTATCEKQAIKVEEKVKHNRPSPEILQQHCEHKDIDKKEKTNNDIPDEKLAKEPGIQIEIKQEKETLNLQKSEKTINQHCSPKKEVTTPLKENESPSVYAALMKANSEPQVKVKPWMPPFDVDPMSQTFLRMPFTYQSLQVQCSQDSNRPHIKRPMNAFMVWAKQNRATIAKRHPNASNAEISVRLGHIWNQLPNDQQKPYFEEANNLKEKHKHENPNWVYQPRPGRKCRKALFSSTGSQSLPTSPVIRRTAIEKYRERPIQPRSLPNSPIAKRSLWSAENLKTQKGELSEEELQSRIVQELLQQEEEEEERMKSKNEETGNPTMDRYIDEWLSPKRTRKEARDACLMNDAMLPAALSDDDQEMLEQETECNGKDFAKYIKQLKTVDEENYTKLESTICSLEEEDEMTVEKMSVVAQG